MVISSVWAYEPVIGCKAPAGFEGLRRLRSNRSFWFLGQVVFQEGDLLFHELNAG